MIKKTSHLENRKTTVIIPCHNYGRYLSWAISSALHQTRSPKEIIVIDDSSTDNTKEVSENYNKKVRYYRVDFQCAQKTRNYGLAKASGEYILFLDADDFLDNSALEIMENELGSNNSLKLVYTGRYNFGNRDELNKLNFNHIWESENFKVEQLHDKNYIAMPSLFKKIGFPGFDPSIGRYQDWDAWLSYLKIDTEAKYIPHPLHHARFHGRNKTTNTPSYSELFKVKAKHNLIQIKKIQSELSNQITENNEHFKQLSLYLIVSTIDTNSFNFLTEIISKVGKSIVGITIGLSSNMLPANLINRLKKSNILLDTQPTNNLDLLIGSAIKQSSFKKADCVILGNFSLTPNIKQLTIKMSTSESSVVASSNYEWKFGLENEPFVAFNHRAVLDFFSPYANFQQSRTTQTKNNNTLKSFSVFFNMYVGWRIKRIHALIKKTLTTRGG